MAAEGKKDRISRLLRIISLLSQSPNGLSPKQIATLCHVSVRTVYRDIKALDFEMKVPLRADHGIYGIDSDYFLPPLFLTLQEAMALFISARLFSRYSDESDPNIESAFNKLGLVLPAPIAGHVKKTVTAMAAKHANPGFAHIFQNYQLQLQL